MYFSIPESLNAVVLDGLHMAELHAPAHAVKVQLQVHILQTGFPRLLFHISFIDHTQEKIRISFVSLAFSVLISYKSG
jgi:hypothetical protein